MSARALARNADAHAALLGAALLGTGALLALAGLAVDRLPLAAGAAAAAGAGFVLLVVTGTIDELGAVLLVLPLPALYADDAVRLTIAAPATAAAVFGWYCRRGLERRAFRAHALPVRSGQLLLGWLAVATAFAIEPAVSLRELVNVLVIAGFLFAAVDVLAAEPARRARLVTAVVAIAGVTGALATLQALALLPGEFPRWGTPYQRAALGFGQPNGLGLFLALAIPFAVHERTHAGTPAARVQATAALVAIALGLTGTFSRGAWLAAFLGTGILFATGGWRRVLRLWLAVLAGAVLLDAASGGAIRDTFVRTLGDWVVEQRAALALAGLAMFAAHPVVGVGPGGFAVALEDYGAQISALWDYLPTPHNVYIQFAAEAGLIALLAYVVFLAATLRAHVAGVRRAVSRYGPHTRETSLREAAAWSVAIAVVAGLAITPFAHGTGQLLAVAIALGCTGSESA